MNTGYNSGTDTIHQSQYPLLIQAVLDQSSPAGANSSYHKIGDLGLLLDALER